MDLMVRTLGALQVGAGAAVLAYVEKHQILATLFAGIVIAISGIGSLFSIFIYSSIARATMQVQEAQLWWLGKRDDPGVAARYPRKFGYPRIVGGVDGESFWRPRDGGLFYLGHLPRLFVVIWGGVAIAAIWQLCGTSASRDAAGPSASASTASTPVNASPQPPALRSP
jgi:hypothetical protein